MSAGNISQKVRWSPRSREIFLALLVFVIITLGFFFSPVADGDDWETFYGAAWRILVGQNLYTAPVTFAYYSNPPWVALSILPVGLLPFRWGWALLSTASFLAVLAVARRWGLSLGKTALALLSPSMLYIVLHGQIDMLLLAGLWLPQAWWPLLALAKPQVAFGLLFGVPRRLWLQALLITGGAALLCLALFGPWPLDLIRQPRPFTTEPHNLWLGLWPFQVPAGVTIILLGVSRRDEKLLVAGSPFLFPYAATSSLVGPWLAASYFLKDWQALLVWLSWWGAVLYRGLGGG